MLRSPAWMLNRLAWTVTCAVAVVAPGQPALRYVDASAPRHSTALGQLQVAPTPPRLLAIPEECRPVGLDFVPPMPQVPGNRQAAAAPQARPLPVESSPRGLQSVGASPQLLAARTQRLPAPETEQQPVLRGANDRPLLIERLEPAPRAAQPQPTVERAVELTAPARSGMQAVSDRALAIVRHGEQLADKGAYYSARSEFIQALRVITQALDAQTGDRGHSTALAQGLRALQEADDFSPHGSQLEADLDLASIVAGHRTPVLKSTAADNLSPLSALQQYYTYAQQQLALAGGEEPAASQALYGIGRLTIVMAQRSPDERRLHAPKAMALFHAALASDGHNWRAAHELGVLYAQFGQFEAAKGLLVSSASIRPRKETWQNLAVVHDRLGESDLAQKARYEMKLLAQQAPAQTAANGLTVEWVDPSRFAPVAANSSPAVRAAKRTTSPRSNPWLK